MYYDINKTLSYNCLFNFVIGPRGNGKTYGAKKHGIKNFKRKGEEFIYLRRYQTEIDDVKEKLFADIHNEFSEDKLEDDGSCIYINDSIAGYMLPLSTSQRLKSVAFPNVQTIIFDEFIIDKGSLHYLNNEVIAFLEFYETVARMRDVKVFFLSNAITVLNPYFLYFNLKLPKNKNISVKGDLLLQLVQNDEFIEAKSQTRFGKLIQGTSYGDYAIEAKFLRDNDTFIDRKTGNAQYFFTFKYKEKLYGVWRDYTAGRMYISNHVDPSCKLVYALTLEDHSPNLMVVKRLNNSPLFKSVLEAFKFSYLWFEDIQIKGMFYDIIKLTIL